MKSLPSIRRKFVCHSLLYQLEGNWSVIVNEACFHSLSRYSLQLLPTDKEMIRRFVMDLNMGL